MKISVVMVDGGFRENFSSLRYWLNQTLPSEEYELIWVDYTDDVAPEVKVTSGIRHFTVGRHDEPQVLAYAFNKGIQEARGEIIVLPDADVACEGDLLETIGKEISQDPEQVLYVLRLDQPRGHFRADQDLYHLRRTCSIKHTFNYGGCTAVRREHLIAMNGYEQLPFFAGYHYNGGDNYIRFKNMGLKVRWHPEQRVYHAWHPSPPERKFDTAGQQEQLIRWRAATGEWMAYSGIDPARNRAYDPRRSFPSEWPSVTTERGPLRPYGLRKELNGRDNLDGKLDRVRGELSEYGLARGLVRVAGSTLVSIGKALTDVATE